MIRVPVAYQLWCRGARLVSNSGSRTLRWTTRRRHRSTLLWPRTFVPQLEDAPICAVSIGSQQADRRRVQGEVLTFNQRQSDSACCESCAELTVREQRNRAFHFGQPCDESVGPNDDVGGRFTAGATVAPDVPTRMVPLDISGAPALEVAVVPFRQVRPDLAARSQTGEIAGLPSAQAGADEHARDSHRLESDNKAPRLFFADGREGKVRQPRVLASQGPSGLTVANQAYRHIASPSMGSQPRLCSLANRQSRGGSLHWCHFSSGPSLAWI